METHVVSILKPGKYPALPSSYRPIRLLNTVGKLLEKKRETNESGLVHDKQSVSRLRHSTALQLARLVERCNKNFDERRLTGAVSWMWPKPYRPKFPVQRGENLILVSPSPHVPNVFQFSHIHTS
jgi:hypothetical protein